MIEVLKQALAVLELVSTEFVCDGAHHTKKDRHEIGEPCPIVERYEEAIKSLRQAIREHAMYEVQRLGQEIEQEPVQEPEYRCCPHDSDCAVHNMPAYPAGPCDCSYSNTFNLPSSSLVHEVCLKLAKRELEKLTNENFGRTPNDTWTNKIVDVYDFFDNNLRAKKLTEIYTTHPPQLEQNFCPRCGKRTNDIHTCTPPQRTEQEPVQVSPLEFVEMVMEKEHLIGKPIFWAEWPNQEKNT